ncbi:hypothetical protein RCL1_004063 [Eukaryota sp. TZLM3-RCL]
MTIESEPLMLQGSAALSLYAPSVVSGIAPSQTSLKEEDFPALILSLKTSKSKLFIFTLLCIVTLGIFPLLCYWFPKLRCAMLYVRTSPPQATLVAVVDVEKNIHVLTVIRKDNDFAHFFFRHIRFTLVPPSVRTQLCITVHLDGWSPVEFIPVIPNSVIIDRFGTGLTTIKAAHHRKLFGINELDIPIGSIFYLLITESLNPFYIFQAASVVLWTFSEYLIYASCIFFMSFFSVALSVYETRKNRTRLSQMARTGCMVEVLREGSVVEVSSSELVPGDVFYLPLGTPEFILPCDAVLLSGSCLVDEASMTGESTPVPKCCLISGNSVFSPATDRRHTLFCGTTVIRVKPAVVNMPVKALVTRTGFFTAKGTLVRNILFPKSSKLAFYTDAFKFIGIFALVASIGCAYSIYVAIKNGAILREIIIRSLDVITIVVPPALPAAMSVGTSFSLLRLRKERINCISPTRINVAGVVGSVFFDKTGTLTEEGLDVSCCYDVALTRFDDLSSNLVPSLLRAAFGVAHSLSTDDDGNFLGDPLDVVMVEAANWSVEELVSDQATEVSPIICRPNYEYEDDFFSQNNLKGLSVLRRFDFSSTLQRMSVIALDPSSRKFFLIVKGAPEAVVTLCDEDTIPKNLSSVLDALTAEGKRVLAIGGRVLPGMTVATAYKAPRSKIEKHFEFLGLIVFTNRVRVDSGKVINHLIEANLSTTMVTGDHVSTAIAVSRDVGIIPAKSVALVLDSSKGIPSFTLSGILDNLTLFSEGKIAEPSKSLNEQLKSRYPSVNNLTFSNEDEVHRFILDVEKASSIRQSKWFSKPEKKLFCNGELSLCATGRGFRYLTTHPTCPRFSSSCGCLTCLYISKGRIFARMTPDDKQSLVSYHGDDGVFCGDGMNDAPALRAAGVGISLSEAEASIAAPFTAAFPSVSCVTATIREGRAALVTSLQSFKFMALYSIIQFITVLVLYRIGSNLGDWQFLWIDLFLIIPLAVAMARGKPAKTLSKQKVPSRLVSTRVLTSLFFHVIFITISQVFVQSVLVKQSWFVPLDPLPDDHNILCFENSVAFLYSNLQYTAVAVAINVAKPHKKSNLTNPLFVFLCLFTLIGGVFIVIQHTFISEILQLRSDIPFGFRIFILEMAIVYFVGSFLFERCVAERIS